MRYGPPPLVRRSFNEGWNPDLEEFTTVNSSAALFLRFKISIITLTFAYYLRAAM